MGRIGIGELVVLLLVVILLFGTKRLPEIGRSLAEAMKAFKDAFKGNEDEHDKKG